MFYKIYKYIISDTSENAKFVEKNLFAVVDFFISDISHVSSNIWLAKIVSRHLFL